MATAAQVAERRLDVAVANEIGRLVNRYAALDQAGHAPFPPEMPTSVVNAVSVEQFFDGSRQVAVVAPTVRKLRAPEYREIEDVGVIEAASEHCRPSEEGLVGIIRERNGSSRALRLRPFLSGGTGAVQRHQAPTNRHRVIVEVDVAPPQSTDLADASASSEQ